MDEDGYIVSYCTLGFSGGLSVGRGSKVNFVTPLLSVQAVFALSNPALVLARGVYVTQTPLVARQAAFASPNTARVV